LKGLLLCEFPFYSHPQNPKENTKGTDLKENAKVDEKKEGQA